MGENSAMGMLDAGDEDAMLQQALAMSMAENQAEAPTTGDNQPAATSNEDEEDDDAAMQMALAMSMQADVNDESASTSQFQDPQFVNQLLGSMPGVDPNDPSIKEALEGLEKSNADAAKKKDGDDKDDSK